MHTKQWLLREARANPRHARNETMTDKISEFRKAAHLLGFTACKIEVLNLLRDAARTAESAPGTMHSGASVAAWFERLAADVSSLASPGE